MKYKIIKYFFVALVVSSVTSCKKYLDVNSDSTRPLSSSAAVQLPVTQLLIGNGIGDRLFEVTSIWSQYYTGGPGVALGDWDKNTMATSEGNTLFNALYRSSGNLNYIVQKSGEPYYVAIAKILIAYNVQVAADLFGDIPFTEAWKGDINDGLITSPKYDNAKDVVYPGIEKMIKEALILLDSNDAGLTKPGSEDLIYSGNLDSWKKFGNSLLLKMYLREGNAIKFTEQYGLAAAADNLILDNDFNAKLSYPGDAKGKNPFWNDAKSTALGNYYVASKTTIDFLKGTDDPRIGSFFNPNGANTHFGLKQGDVENSPASADYSRPHGAKADTGGFIFNPKAPVILMSAWEVNFIIAEAAARGWISEVAQDFYENGVIASGNYFSIEDSIMGVFLASGGLFDATDLNTQIKSIATQKWVAMNGLQAVESWIETRRIDNASNPIFASPGGLFVTPTNNVLGGNVFPSIFYYPATEQDLNSNFPGQNELTDKLFWDN